MSESEILELVGGNPTAEELAAYEKQVETAQEKFLQAKAHVEEREAFSEKCMNRRSSLQKQSTAASAERKREESEAAQALMFGNPPLERIAERVGNLRTVERICDLALTELAIAIQDSQIEIQRAKLAQQEALATNLESQTILAFARRQIAAAPLVDLESEIVLTGGFSSRVAKLAIEARAILATMTQSLEEAEAKHAVVCQKLRGEK